jgi:glucose/arabinose dehydrogenase
MILKRVRVSLSTMALLIAGCGSGANPPQTAATQDAKAAMRIEHAYVGEGNSSNVYVYEIGSKKLSRTVSEGVNEPFDLAFDASNNLYVLNSGNDTVTIYAENDGRPKLTISAGIRWPVGLALDNTNGLYVLNSYNKTITVYNRKSGKERYSISSGLSYPVAIAVGPDQNLYVANGANIAVYAPGTQTPSRTIATGIIVLGGTLTVFTPAGRELRTYTQGLGRTESMHVAPSGDVYVGAKTQVSVFTPKVPDQPAFYIEHRPYVHAVAFGP